MVSVKTLHVNGLACRHHRLARLLVNGKGLSDVSQFGHAGSIESMNDYGKQKLCACRG
jgi:hypothetical protein